MSRLSKLPCQPIHLALLAVAAYFVVHSFSLLTMGLLSLLLLVFGFRQGKTVFIRTLPLIALCGLFFGYQKVQWERADQLAPEQVTTVQVIPDTIEVNGDSLSFRGRADGQTYQVFYKLTSQEEQTYFQKLTGLVCLLILPRFLLTAGGVLTFTYAFLLTVFDFEDLGQVKKAAVESLSISLGILPVLMTYFYAFQPLSILLTFAFSFVFDVLLLPGLSVIFLLSPIVKITWVNGFFVFMEKIIVWVADLGLRPWILGKPSELVLLLLLVSLFLLYDFHRRKKWLLGLSLVLALLFFITKHPLENEVTVVDIGQGDSIFLRDMRGRTVLIDVGGRVDFAAKEAWQERSRQANAERTLIPYLHSRGVDRIDSLVLTHTDTDHVGDVLEVAKQVQIGRIVVSPGSLTVPDFVATLKKINVPVHVVKVGDRLPIFDSYLEVLYPDGTGDGGNNDSIVLYGRLLETNFLFTGDLEQGELDLIETYPNLPVDVLKAGHHGSKGSSYPEFLDHIGAKIALVSAGENNRYKHPHQETLERFDSRNIQVYRTDQQGAIRFRGWKEWKIETVRR
ncbi:TPA: ComEC/Rec2 family competence protein [Streptococcus suis]|nr:ComEC/Rec2 family competence protein [Streptococcus suis]HEM3907721.1 ComEC/Rec2 family competence protein [Streptococcus suis]HEM4017465.1 ComEC/Rec2 family competence protein [Streptococcus suis]HEM4037954.1 ComEC/Rec2 family competence protein [Streptococcus suis]HEM4150509.1 ComEC/Rec2 family competence protein [Streptococcus suis]